MQVPPISKLKEALRAYCASLGAEGGPLEEELAGFRYYRGIRTGTQKLPSICVGTLAFEPAINSEDSPLWSAAVLITIDTRVVFVDGLAEASEDAHDAIVTAFLTEFTSEGLRSFANSENLDRPDLLNEGEGFHIAELITPKVVKHYDEKHTCFCTSLSWSNVEVMNSNGDE